MTSFDWLQNPALILATITHPSVWPWVAYDDQPPEDFRVPGHVAFAAVKDGGTYLGMFGFESISRHAVKAHIYLLPVARGRGAELGESVIGWLAGQDPELSLVVGEIPEGNRLALACLRRIGFQEVGRLTGAVTQQGATQDLVISQFIVRR